MDGGVASAEREKETERARERRKSGRKLSLQVVLSSKGTSEKREKSGSAER